MLISEIAPFLKKIESVFLNDKSILQLDSNCADGLLESIQQEM